MYFYLGQETVINTKNIVGIFDLDNTSISKITKEYLTKAQQEERVVEVSKELPKSFVVYEENGVKTLYLTHLSAATLNKRANNSKFYIDRYNE